MIDASKVVIAITAEQTKIFFVGAMHMCQDLGGGGGRSGEAGRGLHESQ